MKLFKSILVFALGVTLFYLASAFILFDINAANWPQHARGFVALFGLVFGSLAAGLYFTDGEK